MRKTFLFAMFLILVAACSSPTDTSQSAGEPENVPPVEAGANPTARVVDYTFLPDVQYLDIPVPVYAPTGSTFHAVAIEFEVNGSAYTTMLNLDEVKLTTKDGNSISPITLTIGPDKSSRISDLAYFSHIGGDSRTLDFGFGFSGTDTSMSVAYVEGRRDSLTMYHGETGTRLTFLFLKPVGAESDAIQLPGFPEMPLE